MAIFCAGDLTWYISTLASIIECDNLFQLCNRLLKRHKVSVTRVVTNPPGTLMDNNMCQFNFEHGFLFADLCVPKILKDPN